MKAKVIKRNFGPYTNCNIKKKELNGVCVVISSSVECWRAWVTAIQADIDYDNGVVKKKHLGDCYCTPVYV